MSYKVSDEDVELMRCVLGSGPSEMDLIRALHLAKNDVNLAFKVLFDTIGYKGTETNVKRTTAGSGARVLTTCLQEQVPSINKNSDTTIKREHMHSSLISDLDVFTNDHVESIKEEENRGFCFPNMHNVKKEPMASSFPSNLNASHSKTVKEGLNRGVLNHTSLKEAEEESNHSTQRWESGKVSCGLKESMDVTSKTSVLEISAGTYDDVFEHHYDKDFNSQRWLFLGETEVLGYSTSKGAKLKQGDKLTLSFPKQPDYRRQMSSIWNRGKGVIAAQQIVRFGTNEAGDVCIMHFHYV